MNKFQNNPILNNSIFNLIARILLGGMFIIVGLGKSVDASQFSTEIANYNLLPLFLVNPVAIILPWIELIVGILILFGIKIKANSIITGTLLLFFITAITIAVAKGLNIDCGCYSNLSSQQVGLPKILENVGLLILALYLFFFPESKYSLNR